MIGIAAVRYFLVKFSRGKVIAFDLEEALSFQGESGPYIQYAIVRINNIFRKLQERDGLDEAALVAPLATTPAGELTGDNGHELWSLVLEAARLDEVVEQVVASLEFSVLAKYAFGLAQAFNAFYNLHPSRSSIFNEERDGRAPVARGGRHLSAQSVDARTGPDGNRRSCENVAVPVIAIAPCSKPHDYEAAIERAGGEILRLDRHGAPARRRDRVGGRRCCCPAAETSCRRCTARPRIPRSRPQKPGRDDYELELARRALEANLPLLAICRGAQVLNVACGGSLVQHIPDQVGHAGESRPA